MLLLRGGDTLTPRAWERLETVFRTDDPTDELSAAWGIKEQLRRLLATDTLAQAWQERMRMGYFAQIANMPETTKLYDTVVTWWDAIEVLIVTGATTAKSQQTTSSERSARSGGATVHQVRPDGGWGNRGEDRNGRSGRARQSRRP